MCDLPAQVNNIGVINAPRRLPISSANGTNTEGQHHEKTEGEAEERRWNGNL